MSKRGKVEAVSPEVEPGGTVTKARAKASPKAKSTAKKPEEDTEA